MRYTLALTLSMAAFAHGTKPPWPDSLTGLIKEHRHMDVQGMLRTRSGAGSLPADFVQVMTRLDTSEQNRQLMLWTQIAFDIPLRESFRSATFAAYQAQVLDVSAPEPARASLLGIMAQQESSLTLALRDSLVRMQQRLLGDQSAPVSLKALALKQLGSNSHLADLGVLLQHTRSGDVRLKDAAYQGLGHRIRLNRKTGDSTGIRQLFDSLKASAGENPDLHHVRAMGELLCEDMESICAS
jgi:hypothetical protein